MFFLQEHLFWQALKNMSGRMKISLCRLPRASGLTLMELLVVLLVVAMGWFTLLPRLDPTDPAAAQDRPLLEVNELLARAADAARSSSRFQEVRLQRHLGRMTWGENVVRLPSAVAECRINDAPCSETETTLRIYAHGWMDRITLGLYSGERWTSADLATRLIQADAHWTR